VRIAILSDTHGNLVALNAVMSDMEKRGSIDRIFCLGDVAAVGPQPRESIAFLRKMKWPCVMGNTDEKLAKSILEDYNHLDVPQDEKRRMVTLDKWTAAQLDESDRRFLSELKTTIEMKGRQISLLCYHGSPGSNTEGILATTPDDKVSNILGGHMATVFAGGHTHVQMFRRFRGSAIINPGSVGLPLERTPSGRILNPAHAEYAIVSSVGDDLDVELLTVPYAFSALKKAVRESGMPSPDAWLSSWH
jgi:putative phosphoesterase